METQNELDMKIGTLEPVKLHPANVIIISAEVRESPKKAKYVVLTCKHPEAVEYIEISQIAYLKNNQLSESGLWINKDPEGNIQKGSPLAVFLVMFGLGTIKEAVGKQLPTILNSKGYLCFKAY